MAQTVVRVDRARLRAVVDESPALNSYLREQAREIMNRAQTVFRARQIANNEWRTSITTPPKYVHSFRIDRVERIRGFMWIVRNVDPAAAWVEYGAHAGGRTPVLRYYPLRTALLSQGMIR